MGAPAPSGTAQRPHAHGPARNLGDVSLRWGELERPRDLPTGLRAGHPQPSSPYPCHQCRAASHRVPSPGRPQDRVPRHSWVVGPRSSSGDSDGRPHRRHCKVPRSPTLPMPQPLRGRKNGGSQGDKDCIREEAGRAGEPSPSLAVLWEVCGFLSVPGTVPIGEGTRFLPG